MSKRRGYERHGMSYAPEYYAWANMLVRCADPDYVRYGGRGISVTPSWAKFSQFYADMGPRPIGHSLDRINNNGNYEPGNCRWATIRQQSFNKRSNKVIMYRNIESSLSEWCEVLGLNRNTISERIRKLGWSVEDALTKPIGKYPPRSDRPRMGSGVTEV